MVSDQRDSAIDGAWRDLVDSLSDGADLDATWVPLVDAAAAAGVSRSALRAWYRSGQIPSRLEPGPHGPQRLVPRELVVERALHGRGRLANPKPDPAEPMSSPVDVLVSALSERENRLEGRIVELEDQLGGLLARAVAAETELQLWRDGWRPAKR